MEPVARRGLSPAARPIAAGIRGVDAAVDFDGYVQSRGRSLQRLAFLLCGDHHLAEDLTQIALAKAFVRWGRVSRADHPDAYVRQVLVRSYLAQQRRRAARELVTPTPFRRAAITADVADDVVGRAAARTVLAGLSPRARTVIVLRYFVDLDDTAIAELLGVTPSAVRSMSSRTLARLRQSLAADTEDEEVP